jgi:hypothetical protein
MWESERYDYEDVILDKDIRLGDNCSRLEIKLEQYKGEKGTLNVVLGDFKLYEIIDEEEEE